MPIERELYLGIVLDRARGKNVFMASADGGVEIEEVAAKTPERILKEPIEPGLGLTPFQARKLAFGIGISGAAANLAAQAMMALARANEALDASLAEINPFILTKDGKVYALDAKMNLDDNALFRHKDLQELRDLNEEDPLEVEASRFGLNYIKLDGNVACLVNGAGLGHGHHGYREVRGRQSGEFSGCRRRRQRRTDPQRVSHPAFRQIREGGADQCLLRDSARRYRGAGRGGSCQRR